jgi:hypothetical protein
LGVTAVGALTGGVVGGLAAPPVWTPRNRRIFGAIVSASVLAINFGLVVLSAMLHR